MLCITAINTSNTIRTQTGAAVSLIQRSGRKSCYDVITVAFKWRNLYDTKVRSVRIVSIGDFRKISGWSIVMTVSVSDSVCVCVCLSAIISSELHVRFSPIFLFMLPMAVVRVSSGGVMIRYVLWVLWMTSYLLISSLGCSTSSPSWSAAHT